MRLDLFEQGRRGPRTIIHRAPAALKLVAGLTLIGITVLLPSAGLAWLLTAAAILTAVTLLSRLSPIFVLKRLFLLAPFVLGVAVVNAFQPAYQAEWPWLLGRSVICLLTVIIVSNTTPFSHVLGVLRQFHVPALLITTMALMHRYLFVLMEEAERMRRARASRTFRSQRRWQWSMLATVAGQLFIRASERAERIYAAMCARGLR